MKSMFLTLGLLMLTLSLVSCGKKAENKDKDGHEKTFLPTEAELYFNAITDIENAIESNDAKALEKAISENPGLNLDLVLTKGDTFLILAIKKNLPEIRNILIERGANPGASNFSKETPLMAATRVGNINCLRALLDQGVELNKKNTDGDTALHIALKLSHEDIALELIKEGANLELTDNTNKNAQKLAEENKCDEAYELIQSLLQVEYGAPDIASFRNILIQGDVKGLSTVLHRYPSIVNDYESINPLALLVDIKDQNAALRSAELLITDYKANVNGPLNADITPVIKATTHQNKPLLNLYLKAEANPQLQDKEGKSALIHAVQLNDLEIVDLLLSYSAVEKYTFRKDGRKVTYNACSIAKDMAKTLTDDAAKKTNKAIQKSLDCGFFSWLF